MYLDRNDYVLGHCYSVVLTTQLTLHLCLRREILTVRNSVPDKGWSEPLNRRRQQQASKHHDQAETSISKTNQRRLLGCIQKKRPMLLRFHVLETSMLGLPLFLLQHLHAGGLLTPNSTSLALLFLTVKYNIATLRCRCHDFFATVFTLLYCTCSNIASSSHRPYVKACSSLNSSSSSPPSPTTYTPCIVQTIRTTIYT